MIQKSFIAISIIWAVFLSGCKQSGELVSAGPKDLFIGTYTKKEGHVDGKAEGIYWYDMNPKTGEITYRSVAKEVVNPSFLAISPGGNFLYAVNETGPDVDSTGSISAFAIDKEKKILRLLNRQSSHSFAPCHISVDSKGRFVFVANYVGGKVVVLPVEKDGSLGKASEIITLEGSGTHSRQEASHPHSVVLSADDRFAYVPDLGTDKIMIFKVDYENGKLLPNEMPFLQLPAGSGPRHFTIHPNNKFAYVINELTSTIALLSFDETTGKLGFSGYTPTLPAGFRGNNLTADIHISPDGKFLYGSNRGHDSIAAFKIDELTGKLTLTEHEPTRGAFPRNFMITNDGKFLYAANQNSGNISIFKIEKDGALTFVEQVNVPTPVCLKMM